MKRFLAVALSSCLVLGMAVSSFAFTLPSDHVSIEMIDGVESTVFQTFITSALSSTEKKFLENWISSPYRYFSCDEKGEYLFADFFPSSNSDFPSRFKAIASHYGSLDNHSLNISISSGSNVPMGYMVFKDAGNGTFVKGSFYPSLSLGTSSGYSVKSYIFSAFADTSKFTGVCPDCFLDDSYPLPMYIRDDGGLFGAPDPDADVPDPPDPPDPPPITPPDISEPPPIQPPEIKPPPSMSAPPIVAPPSMPGPVIPPSDSKYVPYDTSALHRFLDYIRQVIGSSTNIGLLIFAIIFGIGLIPKIIRIFSRGK